MLFTLAPSPYKAAIKLAVAQQIPILVLSIVLPENWTGGLDGESEETRTPSGEIYETTT
jgi:hypothetical protein